MINFLSVKGHYSLDILQQTYKNIVIKELQRVVPTSRFRPFSDFVSKTNNCKTSRVFQVSNWLIGKCSQKVCTLKSNKNLRKLQFVAETLKDLWRSYDPTTDLSIITKIARPLSGFCSDGNHLAMI